MAEDRRGAAFFDLDRTIISGSSVFIWGWVAYRAGMMPTGDLLRDLLSYVGFKLKGAGDAKTEAVKNRVLQAIEGVHIDEFRALGDDILVRLLDDVRHESRALIDLHDEAGRDTYIVSASPIEIIDGFAEAMHMTGAIGTVAELKDGVYTGELAEPFCYGPGKAEAIVRMAEEKGYDLQKSYAYSDSIGDLPMLEAVGHPVAVNPDKALAAISYQRGWPIVEFSRRSKKVIKRTTATAGAVALAGSTYLLGRRHGKASVRPGLIRRVFG
jgi:HAD superfamily hydrolase (TIGR01490 family)